MREDKLLKDCLLEQVVEHAAIQAKLPLSETFRSGADPHPERVVGGQHSNNGCRNAHHEQGEIEYGLAADPVAEMTEDDTAERPRNKAERKSRKRQQRADHRIESWKEQFVEDQRGRGAIKEEIVPFDSGADEARGRDFHMGRPYGLQRNANVVRKCCNFAGAV